jgi:transposase
VKAQVFEAIVHDVRMRLRDVLARMPQPRASIKDRRTRQSSPESDDRTGWDGHKRRKGSKVHIAVDTLGQLLAVLVTPANAQECAQIGELAEQVQAVTGESVEIGFVDQGYTGEQVAEQAAAHGIRLEVVKLPEAKKGFVLLPRRWVVERSFGWMARFRRLARDYERLSETLAGLHFLACAMLMLKRFVSLMLESA